MKVFELSSFTPPFTFTPRTPFTANPSSVIHNIHGRGGYVYIAHYDAGVYVADVRNPLAITSAGGYDTYTGSSPGYIGCWGVYPYFPSGRWVASDTQTGLYVFTFTGLAPRTRSPLIAPANGDTLQAGTLLSFRWRAAAVQADDPHRYDLHVRGSGLDTTVTTTDTTLSLGPLADLQEGEEYSWSVVIRDEYTRVAGADTFRFVAGGIGTDVEDGDTPGGFALSANYPNPFNPETRFDIRVGVPSVVRLTVYDVLGREVLRPAEGVHTAGAFPLAVNASGLASGVYICRVTATPVAGGAPFIAVRRMVVTK
jgi:hypothetical protein